MYNVETLKSSNLQIVQHMFCRLINESTIYYIHFFSQRLCGKHIMSLIFNKSVFLLIQAQSLLCLKENFYVRPHKKYPFCGILWPCATTLYCNIRRSRSWLCIWIINVKKSKCTRRNGVFSKVFLYTWILIFLISNFYFEEYSLPKNGH